ncbi:hypothetical protein BG011_004159 [Mortierella polycephala]|uniref:SAPS-domain-containing protein n=1 Tax=Mortierella polycephala TaxID=41804 RepID=A0A9P6U2S6_9FUNG|nr:hypothetical protein BG011_004159 [Mortierella polycephala]
MYWRFGHQAASVIDHLLENSNISLEELLEQDDLIQECKAQNPRLIEYLRDPAVLQQLLSYITSDDLEDRARFKYPFIACEVIACEVWGIFESAFANIDILIKFWEFLDRPPPLNPVQASYFAKVIGIFLMKKTSESQPEVVPKLLLHMSTSSIMDLLLKIISMEESPEGKGTVQWLSEQGLMPWLVNRLDPNFDEEVHSIASQVLLDIIAISQSSHPEQPSIGTNMLIDELKSEVIVSQLVSFMLDRDAPFSSSTLINGVTIFIELIRRNNSDYDVEPLPPNAEPPREPVDLSDLLKVLASRIEDFKDLLIMPRSVTGPVDTSIGKQVPLGFERLKICEMFAELLHCSNMAVLNSRPIISVSADGTVRIPTVTVNCFHHELTIHLPGEAHESNGDTVTNDGSINNSAAKDDKDSQKVQDSNERASGAATPTGPGSAGAEAAQAADNMATPKASPRLDPCFSVLASPTIAALASTDSLEGEVMIPVGDFLKLQFVDYRIISTCFDLFFQFPWNNFLHTVVYDMVHQVFHRPMGDIGRPDVNGTYIPPKSNQDLTEGWNRRLTISIFKDGQLTKRITDAQRLCDYECAQPKGVRLGYMGHLTYIADETVKLLELYSQTSLLPTLYEFIDLEDWWNYVSKILKETKERDAQVLGGTRPNVIESHKAGLDDANDDDYMDDNDDEYGDGSSFIGDSGTGLEGDVASDQFARYLCQQITNNLPDKFGSSDEDEDDEEGNWVAEYGGDSEFNIHHTGAGEDDPFGNNNHAMDFEDSDDDEGVDEETWNEPWPGMPSVESKPSEPNAATRLNTTLVELPSDSQDGFSGLQSPASNNDNSNENVISQATQVTTTGASTNDNATNTATTTAATPSQPAISSTNTITSTNTSTIASDDPEHAESAAVTIAVPAPSSSALGPEESIENAKVENENKNASNTINNVSTMEKMATNSENCNPEPVKLAPGVQETPAVKGTLQDMNMGQPSSTLPSSSVNSAQPISSTAVEPALTPASSLSSVSPSSSSLTTTALPSELPKNGQQQQKDVNMEAVPLAADTSKQKLDPTTSDVTETKTKKEETVSAAEISGVAKKVEQLDLTKQG